jgi:hypothetical protein
MALPNQLQLHNISTINSFGSGLNTGAAIVVVIAQESIVVVPH